MNSTELHDAADRIRASTHPAATQIADLLIDAATELSHRETVWEQTLWPPTIQADLTRWLFGKHIALAQQLTEVIL